MNIGLQISNFSMPGGPPKLGQHLRDMAVAADQVGFSSLWVMDHFFQVRMVGTPEQEMLEAYVTLGYMAALTRSLRLGVLITGVTYRHPGILIKTVTSLDVLSGGRANLGIGAAWNEAEHRALGVPFPPVKERFERLEETLQIALRMFRGDRAPFEGKHYQLADPLNSPQAVTRPHPPIVVGGGGERKTLRLVAQYADACNVFWDPNITPHKLEVLRTHCDAVGRNYDDIEKTTAAIFDVTPNGGDASVTPEQMVEQLAEQRRCGIDHVILSLRNAWEIDRIELIGARVIPQVARL